MEIHYRLFDDRKNLLTREMIEKSTPFSTPLPAAFSPPPLLTFLYLIKHLTKHEKSGNSQLRLYLDLVLMLKNYRSEILIPELRIKAKQAGISIDLEEKLHLLGKWFGLPRLEPDLANINPDQADSRFLAFLSNPKGNEPDEPEGGIRNQVKSIRGLFPKMIFITGMLFPSLTFMKWRYDRNSSIAAILMYPVRWWTIVRKVIKGVEA